MNLKITKENSINDLNSWFRYAEPEGGEKQWKEGRSAMEFARYMTSSNGKLPKQIEAYLKAIGIKDKSCYCIPEHVTEFPQQLLGKGSGRHHDGLLVSDSIIVGIEAKVSESFDKSVRETLKEAMSNKDKGKNMRDRIINSLKMITRKPTPDESEVSHLMYQLISATVGTVLEAELRGKDKAVVLIIEFAGDIEDYGNTDKYKQEVAANQQAYDDYLEYLGLVGKSDVERYLNVNEIKVWFKKIRVEVKRQVFYE
ncbi:MAG: hypothetical protein MJZ16_00580 [Bacteroidales bacterium]|nr:hypothetical protein [Bacteroidales bacterium]